MRKKTHAEYVVELANKNPSIEIVGEYIGSNINVLHRCKTCGHEWSPKPSLILLGFSCPQCNKRKMTKTHEQYVNELHRKNADISVIGMYVNYHTRITHKCNICEHEWELQPANALNGTKCPRCTNHVQLTQDDFINRVKEIHPMIQVIGEYKGSDFPIKVKCLKDDFVWEPKATNLIHLKRGCPKCNQSRGELQVEIYLKKHNINYMPRFVFSECKNKRPLPFDFYLPDYNVCIEYDGIQHFKAVDFFGGEDSLKIQQHNDSIKTNYCNLNNIGLLRIKHDQNIENVLDDFFNNTKLIKEAI